MARMNFDKLTLKELLAAEAQIADLIETKKQEERESLKTKLATLASERGFTVDELFNGKTSKVVVVGRPAKGKKIAPKYRNPENGGAVWSGRGRKPLWFVAALKKGVKPEKLLIK